MRAAEEEKNGHALAREIEVIRPEIEVFLRPDVVDRVNVQLGVRGGDAVQRRTQIGVLLADRDDRVLPVPTNHVDVEIGYDVTYRHRGMIREIGASPQPLLLTTHVQKDQ